MLEFLNNLLDSDFMPHGQCYLWQPSILWLHAASDSMIALAYYLIPISLLYFVRKRHDLAFSWIFVLFGIFIFACGTTHVMEVWSIWNGTYRLTGTVKLLTAIASVSTAIALVPLVPRALALPSPAELRIANEALQREIEERRHAEEEVRRLNRELEERVRERTAALEAKTRDLEREVAEHERVEQALRESESRVRLVIESAPNGIVMVDAQGRLVLANAQVERSFGYRREELLGQPVEMLVPERFRRGHLESRNGFMERPEARAMGVGRDLYGRCKDGSEIPVEIGLTPIETAQGMMVLGIIVDITERKEAEQALKKSEQQFRTLAEAMPQIVWRARADGTVDYYNQRWTELTGREREASYGWQWQPVVHPEDEEATREAWQRAIQTGEPYETEHRIRRADGSYRWLLSRGLPLLGSRGEVVQWIGTATDIEEQKQVELALRRAKESAESANRAKSAFLANMSHEIRTPLTAIIGFASLLEQQLPRQHKETAQRIEGAGRRLMETLEAILTLAKLEAHRGELSLEPIAVAREVEDLVQLFKRQAQEKGLTLTFQIAPGAEEARSHLDRGGLTSILQNLISNAIKFTDRGGITVRVEAADEAVHLVVEDTGIGIEENFQPHLFEPFRQASAGMNRTHEGSGLGLAITKQLVEKMKGEISVESALGVGTRVSVCFPLPGETAAERAVRVGSPIASEAQARPSHVLVVEDNEDTQVLLKSLLQRLGAVDVVPSAAEALRAARQRRYDLVLLDINLGGGLSGTQVLHELRSMEQYRDVPMAALTAYALPGDREAFLSEGFDAYLRKPFTVEELMQVAERLLVPPGA